jgi:anti-sigma B factor antagonist
MNITRKTEKDVLIIFVEGAVDSHTSDELKNNLLKLISEDNKFFAVDFSGVTHITSAGLGSLVVVTKMVMLRRGYIALCALNDLVKKVFAIVKFESYIKIFETREEAIVSVTAARSLKKPGTSS